MTSSGGDQWEGAAVVTSRRGLGRRRRQYANARQRTRRTCPVGGGRGLSLKKTPPCGLPVQINASVSGHCVGLLLLLLRWHF